MLKENDKIKINFFFKKSHFVGVEVLLQNATPECSRELNISQKLGTIFFMTTINPLKRCFYCHLFPVYTGFFFLSHPVNDLLDGVQANDARAFLVGPCVPGFTLCAEKNGQNHCITSAKKIKIKKG